MRGIYAFGSVNDFAALTRREQAQKQKPWNAQRGLQRLEQMGAQSRTR